VDCYRIGVLEVDKPKRIISHYYNYKVDYQQSLINARFEIEWHNKLINNQLVTLFASFYNFVEIEKYYPELMNDYLMKLQH